MSAQPDMLGWGTRTMHASRRLEVAEHLGLRYSSAPLEAVAPLARLTTGNGSEVLWPTEQARSGPARKAVLAQRPEGGAIPIFASVLDDPSAERLLKQYGGNWERTCALVADDGRRLGSVWRERSGSVLLPFDPDEVCHTFWSERYLEHLGGSLGSRSRRVLMHSYYGVRGLLPRRTQIWLRRQYARVQARSAFPAWPAETALHDFLDFFAGTIAEVAGEPVPRLAPWPQPYRWSFVLTHDVETARGVAAMEPILELERSMGLRSSWNFVPQRYRIDDRLIADLVRDGFEVGVHGLRHDGRDLRSLAHLRRRLPAMWDAAQRWGAVGFRAPASHRNWEWMPLLGFDYDSSYPDTDPFEPQRGGCCSWLPFYNQDLIELPLTMPHDHTLFEILRQDDASMWIEKAELIRARGGMALLVTHPDYLVKPRSMDAYRRLLEHFAEDDTAWRALPAEVSAWWRRRSATTLDPGAEGWTARGPGAAETKIEFVEPACRS